MMMSEPIEEKRLGPLAMLPECAVTCADVSQFDSAISTWYQIKQPFVEISRYYKPQLNVLI